MATKGRGRSIARRVPSASCNCVREDNIQVANCTTPANYFHLLRRQMHRNFRKPLIVMTPKSLLRHKLAVSTAAEFQGDSHFKRILSDTNGCGGCRYDAAGAVYGQGRLRPDRGANAAGDTGTQIVRIEQLYPFPGDALARRIARMPNLKDVVWAQEEPKNNGYWFFVEPLIEESLAQAQCAVKRARYAGRAAAASPATGLMKRHTAEQGALVADALGHNVREEIRRTRSEGSTTTARPTQSPSS